MKKVTKKIMWCFALGQLGWSILSGIVANFLVYFYQPTDDLINEGQTVLIPQGRVIFGLITIIGLITAFSRIFDAITDPIIGAKSDGCKHKDGRRIPFMRAIAVPFAVITTLMFITPVQSESVANGIWLFVCVVLFYLFMTIYCTPYTALIPELGKNQTDRINISTYISLTFIAGSAISYLSPTIWGIFIGQGMQRLTAMRLTFGILSAIALIFMLVPVFTIKEKDYTNIEPVSTNPFNSLMKTFKNKDFRIFVCSDVLYWVAITIFQTGLTYFVVKLMGLEESTSTILFVLMTACSLLFYVPINLIAKKVQKKKLVMFAFAFFALTFLFTSFSGKLGIPAMVMGILVSVFASLPMAILGILPQAIVADIAESDSKKTGENREGMFFAARTFAFKLGQSLAMILFTSLSTIGLETGQGYRIALIVAMVFSLLGAVVLMFYNENNVMKTILNNKENNEEVSKEE